MREHFGKKSSFAAGFLAAALGMSSDRGSHEGGAPPETEPTTQTTPSAADNDSETQARRERARQTHKRLEDTLRALKGHVEQQQELSITNLSKTEVTDEDIMEFARQQALERPKSREASPEFFRLLETVHVDHEGNSYYIYSDSEALNAAARRQKTNFEMLMVIEPNEGYPEHGSSHFLEFYTDAPEGMRRIGRSVHITSPESIRTAIASYVHGELAFVVIGGFPSLESPTP